MSEACEICGRKFATIDALMEHAGLQTRGLKHAPTPRTPYRRWDLLRAYDPTNG